MQIKSLRSFKITAIILSILLIFQQSGFSQIAGEMDLSSHFLSLRNTFVRDTFRPLHLRYLSYDPAANNFNLLLDKGDFVKGLSPKGTDPKESLQQETKTLLNYFFIGISLPNQAFWVNLRPDSPDNIIDPELAETDVGKILLEADLQLKKDTANFTSPKTPEGKDYWDKLYKKAEELYGNENITIPTLTRPWIVPDEIIIRESSDNAYIYKATLKVMLEQDYLKDSTTYAFKDQRSKALNEYSSQLIRETIIPKLTKEINSSKRYAPLRQVYYSLILAQWFKQKFYGKSGVYSHLIDRHKLDGLTSQTSWSKTTYFNAYKTSFQQGEYNIKEPRSTLYGQSIRSYMSGGLGLQNMLQSAMVVPANANKDAIKLFGIKLLNKNNMQVLISGSKALDFSLDSVKIEANEVVSSAMNEPMAVSSPVVESGLNSALLKRAKPVNPSILGGGGIDYYVKERAQASYQCIYTADIMPEDLPPQYSTLPGKDLKNALPDLGQIPASLDGIKRIEVVFPDRDIFLASKGHNGSAGVVRLGFLKDTGRPVAAKAYYGKNIGNRESDREYLLKEYSAGQIAYELGMGPMIHGLYEDGGRLGIIMDIVPGDDPGLMSKYITEGTLEDLFKIEDRLYSHNLSMEGDFQFFVTPEGRIQIIDPAALFFQSSYPEGRLFALRNNTLSILISARNDAQQGLVNYILRRKPDLFKEILKHSERLLSGGKGSQVGREEYLSAISALKDKFSAAGSPIKNPTFEELSATDAWLTTRAGRKIWLIGKVEGSEKQLKIESVAKSTRRELILDSSEGYSIVAIEGFEKNPGVAKLFVLKHEIDLPMLSRYQDIQQYYNLRDNGKRSKLARELLSLLLQDQKFSNYEIKLPEVQLIEIENKNSIETLIATEYINKEEYGSVATLKSRPLAGPDRSSEIAGKVNHAFLDVFFGALLYQEDREYLVVKDTKKEELVPFDFDTAFAPLYYYKNGFDHGYNTSGFLLKGKPQEYLAIAKEMGSFVLKNKDKILEMSEEIWGSKAENKKAILGKDELLNVTPEMIWDFLKAQASRIEGVVKVVLNDRTVKSSNEEIYKEAADKGMWGSRLPADLSFISSAQGNLSAAGSPVTVKELVAPPKINSKNIPAEEIKSLININLEHLQYNLGAEIQERKGINGSKIVSIKNLKSKKITELPEKGLDVLMHELFGNNMPEFVSLELLFNFKGDLIGVFPALSNEIDQSQRDIYAQQWLGLNISYYYFNIPNKTEDFIPAWDVFAKQQLQEDLSIIDSYRKSPQCIPYYLLNGTVSPYVYIEIDQEGNYSAKELFDIARQEVKYPPPVDKTKHQFIIPVFPTVYSPAYRSHQKADMGYYRALWSDAKNLKDEDNVLIVGPAIGALETLMVLLSSKKKVSISVLDRNAFAIANCRFVEKIINQFVTKELGHEFKFKTTLVGDNIIDENDNSRFEGSAFNRVYWNMPSMGREMKSKSGILPSNQAAWDNDPGGKILTRFARGLNLDSVLSLGGSVIAWNIPYLITSNREGVRDAVEETFKLSQDPLTKENKLDVRVEKESKDSDNAVYVISKISGSPVEGKKGGIDLRSLPSRIVIQPMEGAAPVGGSPLRGQSLNLDKEWQEIERMANSGIVPSCERLREYLLSLKDPDSQIDKVLSCIAGILRQEEEEAYGTESSLKEILVLLESGKPVNELRLALAKIQVLAKEPQLITQ